jgi:cytochrome c-550 PedF
MKAGAATLKTTAIVTALIALGSMTTMRVEAHGDVVPQAVDVSTLKALGAEWRKENPYRGDKEAIRIGSSAYNQNCARCHGLEAVSGGIAPDRRLLHQHSPPLPRAQWRRLYAAVRGSAVAGSHVGHPCLHRNPS